jgi:hypothetical protein
MNCCFGDGFSAANLWRMRQLHEAYTAPDFPAQLVREIAPRAKGAKSLSVASSAKLAQAWRPRFHGAITST